MNLQSPYNIFILSTKRLTRLNSRAFYYVIFITSSVAADVAAAKRGLGSPLNFRLLKRMRSSPRELSTKVGSKEQESSVGCPPVTVVKFLTKFAKFSGTIYPRRAR